MIGALHRNPVKRLRAARRALWFGLLRLLPLVPRGRTGQRLRYWIVKMTRLAPLELTIAKGDTVVLVGAVAKGEWCDMARAVGGNGRVIAVEPFPQSVEGIQERARRESITNLTIVPKGAWSQRGKQILHIHPQFSGSNIVLDSGARHDRAMQPDNYAGSLEIDVDRLDDILAAQGIQKCDFIKITVMGAEMHVLKGMERLLKSTPQVWVKAHSLVDGRPANGPIAKLLSDRGYRTVIIRGNQGAGGTERPGDVYGSLL